jgi:parvulin-like peptidyl-prolyl isomerase
MRSMKLLTPLAALALLAGCASTRYLAKVNDDEIRGEELLRVFGSQHSSMESAMGDERDLAKFLGKVVDRRLFVQEAYRIGLQENPAVLEGARRTQLEQLARVMREREIEPAGEVRPEEVKAAWALAPRAFLVRQFVAADQAAAAAARARVVAGEELEAVARAGSIDPSALHGGLVLVRWGGADEEVERVVFGLEVGPLSEVFKSEAGWQFVKVEKSSPLEGNALVKALGEAEGVLSRRKTAIREAALRQQLSAKFGLVLLDCPTAMEALKKAAASGEGPACATWSGGELKLPEIALAMGLEKAGEATPDKVTHVYEAKRRALVDTALLGLEGEARGWSSLPEVAVPVLFRKESLMENAVYAQYVFQGIEVNDAEVASYYQSHQSEFATPASFTLAQIVVETEPEAVELRARLVAGASFEELAKEKSKDAQSAARGGAIGSATAPQLQGPFVPVASLEAGEVSQPIHSKYGWHLVKAVTRTAPTQLKLEACAKDAREKALQSKLAAAYDTWSARLKKVTRITLSEPGLRAFADQRLADVTAKEAALNAKQDAKQKRMEAVLKEVETINKAREAEKAAEKAAKEVTTSTTGAPPEAAAPVSAPPAPPVK